MSRLIASTMTHSTLSLAQTLEKLKAAGFQKVELCSAGAIAPHLDVTNITTSLVKETAKIIRASGMEIHCINIGGNYTLAQMELVYMLAGQVGATLVTYSCGSPAEGVSEEDQLRRHADFNSRLADLGEAYGVICSIEAPHKLSLASTTEAVDRYWAMQDDRVKLTFDPAHIVFAGEDMPALAKRYIPRMVHSHLRDAMPGNSLMRYGEGQIDFGAYLSLLKEGGYSGFFSMEYPSESAEDAEEKLASSVRFLSQFDFT